MSAMRAHADDSDCRTSGATGALPVGFSLMLITPIELADPPDPPSRRAAATRTPHEVM